MNLSESQKSALLRAASGEVPSDEDAFALGELPNEALPELTALAASRRDRTRGAILTFSPKVFLPLTNLCRNRCDYCSFRRSPGDPGEHTMRPDELRRTFAAARETGCVEALFCLGDTPETGFRDYRALLRSFGHERTADYLEWAGETALDYGLLPHTNAGILSASDMTRLKRVNVSLGLMLENVSPRLCEKGMPHHKAPDKRPHVRLKMTEEAGELRIPFTSGLLIGIGETRRERVETLLAIRALHRKHGHIQEVIVQNFRARPSIAMEDSPEPNELELAHTIALARVVLEDDVSAQAPPNLNPGTLETLVASGIDDFGGISPVTPDFINPRHPWPQLGELERQCEALGFTLRPRLPIYERHIAREGFLEPALTPRVEAAKARLARVGRVGELAPEPLARPSAIGATR
jgi:FO synthase